MAEFERRLPYWNAPGIEPPLSKADEGWKKNERPPAEYMNFMHHTTYKAVEELQDNAVHKTEYNKEIKKINSVKKSKVYLAEYPIQIPENDDTARIQRAVSMLNDENPEFHFNEACKISDSIKFKPNTRIVGLKNKTIIDATDLPYGNKLSERFAFELSGSVGDPVSIPVDIPKWSSTLTVQSTQGLKSGDLLYITSLEPYIPGTTSTLWKKGELVTVKHIESETRLTLNEFTIFSYDAKFQTEIKKVTPIENIVIENISIKMAGVGSVHTGIKIKYGRNIKIRNVHITGAEDTGILVDTVYGIDIEGCKIEDCTSAGLSIGNTGYGICLSAGTRFGTVKNNSFRNCRHWISGGGNIPTVFIDVIGNKGSHSIGYGFDCHEPCMYWKFERNKAAGCNGGFLIRGQYITVINNDVHGSTADAYKVTTFDVISEQKGIRLEDNQSRGVNTGISCDGSNAKLVDLVIRNNKSESPTYYGVYVKHFNGLIVDGNEVYNSLNESIRIESLSSIERSSDVLLGNNKVKGSAKEGIKVTAVDDVVLTKEKVSTCIGAGIYMLDCSKINISAAVKNCASNGIHLISCNNTMSLEVDLNGCYYGILIDGGVFHQISNLSAFDNQLDGIRVMNTQDVNINTTITKNPRHGIYITASNFIIVTNNNARLNIHSDKINIDPTAINTINKDNLI
ncbi:right-handed parallel beta-helix repeat-containing protein [Bacillus sp. BSL6]|uniref:right-handed parallel beta-helix repeat-containing protein n=1 Tax=Bacillus TaxID=1386 RepID=UPI003A7F8FB1